MKKKPKLKALKFTAGPWFTYDGTTIRQDDSGGALIASLDPARVKGNYWDNAQLIVAAPDLLKALQLHLAFMDTLPNGWLAHTVADIGLLNDAYLASTKVLRQLRLKP